MIRLDPSTLRERASQYTTAAGDLDDIISRMDSLLSQLQSEWEGSASEGFASKYAELKPGFKNGVDLINEIASALNANANDMEQSDQSAASRWK